MLLANILSYLKIQDIIYLSLASIDIQKYIKLANSCIDHSIFIRDFQRIKRDLCIISPNKRIKMIKKLMEMFPRINKLHFDSIKNSILIDWHNTYENRMERSLFLEHIDGIHSRSSDYFDVKDEYGCDYLNTDELSIFYGSKSLIQSLKYLSISIKCDFDIKGISNFINLEHLEILFSSITNKSIQSEIGELSKLKSLSFNTCNNIDGHIMYILQNYCILCHLTALEFRNCENINSIGYIYFESIRNLTSLTLIGIKLKSAIGFNGIHFLTKLKYLNLTMNKCFNKYVDTNVSNEILSLVSALSSNLITFIFQNFYYISKVGFSFLCKLTNLTTLDISHCLHQRPLVRLTQLQSLKNLCFLNVGNCWQNGTEYETIFTFMYWPKFQYIKTLKLFNNSGLRHFGILSHLTTLTHLDVNNCRLATIGLSFLTTLIDLKYLDISAPIGRLTDTEIEHLSFLKGLETLLISESFLSISKFSLGYLRQLGNLKNIDLSRNDFFDGQEGFTLLSFLSSLNTLRISHCTFGPGNDLTTDSLNFSAFTSLTSLTVRNISITNDELLTVSHLTNLTELDIGGSNFITDDGLSYLKPLKSLKLLSLFKVREITDNGLNSLYSLKSLKKLILSYSPSKCTKISEQKIFELESFFFNLRIEVILCKYDY